MSALKKGTVCYVVGSRHCPWANGHAVTIVGRIACESMEVYSIAPAPVGPDGERWDMAVREVLRPISDPDQPVDVTSDTDEPVTV